MRPVTVHSAAVRAALIALIAGGAIAAPGAAQVAPAAKVDTVRITRGPVPRALLDSVDELLRVIERQPLDLEMRQHLDSLVQRLGEAQVITLGSFGQTAPAAARGSARIYIDGSLTPPSEFAAMSAMQPKGWLGITFGPVAHNEVFTDDGDILSYFDYPSVISIDPDSPAEGVGIRRGDVLVEYDGRDIRGRPLNMTQILQPDHRIALTMRRDGELKSFTMTVAKAPVGFIRRRVDLDYNVAPAVRKMPGGQLSVAPMPPPPGDEFPGAHYARSGVFVGPRVILMNPDGMFGAHLTAVTAELASALHLRVGVLATDVPESAPAYKAGLRTGDVIVAIDGEAVQTLAEVRRTVAPHVTERNVTLNVVRGKKTRKITVRW